MSHFELEALTQPVTSQEGLKHAVLQSLLNWSKAQQNDRLDPGQNKQGWWGSEFLAGVGCRDWTLARAKQTPETLNRAKHYTKQALDWLIKQGTAKEIEVRAYYENDRLVRHIQIRLSDNALREFTL